MFKHAAPILAVALCLAGPLHSAEPSTGKIDKVYGKVVSIDQNAKSLTVFNKKRNQETHLQWDDSTSFTQNKNSIQSRDVAVGQYLMVSYTADADANKAKKVTVRPAPFRKRGAQ